MQGDAARVLHGCCIDAEECKHTQASMQERCSTGAGAMQHGCCTGAEECKHAQASMQERCSTGAARVLHGCRNDAASMQKGRMQALHRCYARIASRCMQAKAALTAQASAICLQYACIVCISLFVSIHAFRGGGDFPRRQFHCTTGVKKRVAHPTRATARQRITARRGGKRGVTGEMRGIVRRVPTCGAFRCAAGGRREDEEDEEDYGERRQRRGIVRRVPTCGAVRRRRLRPIRPLLRRRMPDPLAGAGLLPLVDRIS
jgi:hypothetical protein